MRVSLHAGKKEGYGGERSRLIKDVASGTHWHGTSAARCPRERPISLLEFCSLNGDCNVSCQRTVHLSIFCCGQRVVSRRVDSDSWPVMLVMSAGKKQGLTVRLVHVFARLQ